MAFPRRRRFLTGLGLALASQGRLARGQTPPSNTLIVAGPQGGRTDRWADVLSPAIGRAMPARTPLVRQNIGGIDGVTAANQFEARAEPDGHVALLIPGMAAISWLAGEQRTRFDPARWVPVWGSACPGVLVSRVPLRRHQALRLAAAGPVGPELPALLALELLGVDVTLCSEAGADAIWLHGAGVPGSLALTAQAGLRPALTLGIPGSPGAVARDPQFPGIPTIDEVSRPYEPLILARAVRAASAAARLDAAVMLPSLTPSASIALWRQASKDATQDPDMLHEARLMTARLYSADLVPGIAANIAADPTSLLALRQWLMTRYQWQPA